VDGLAFVRSLLGAAAMPMAEHVDFVLDEVAAGSVRGRATPKTRHENPFGVAQGGFASTVLDIALGLVSISVLEGDATGVMTLDLDVRFLSPDPCEDRHDAGEGRGDPRGADDRGRRGAARRRGRHVIRRRTIDQHGWTPVSRRAKQSQAAGGTLNKAAREDCSCRLLRR
jgi:acyl-coenzyme A thioesterase PaaI-like protein